MNRLLKNLMGVLNHEATEYCKENYGGNLQSRRKFIKTSALGAAGIGMTLTLPSFAVSCKLERNSEDSENSLLDVAILGGGISGLNCANHLLPSGLNFKVFEGSNRLGGRILTHYGDSLELGVFPEFGGDFIDFEHEDMLALVKEFDLELFDQIDEQEKNGWIKDIYYFDGRRISEEEIIEEFKKIVPKILYDKESLGEDYDTPAAEELDNTPLPEYLDSLNCAKWLKDLFKAAWIAEYGLDCEEQPAINMLDMIDTDTSEGFKVFGSSDERYRIKGGNSQIISKLAEKIGGDRILKDYLVNEVTESKDGIYTIKFENGKSVRSKAVVCTIPFTILRDINLNLRDMSEEKRRCIDELGYGNNTKLILGYEGQPWRSKENNAMGYLFTDDITNGWDGSLNKTEDNDYGAYVAYFGGEFSQKLSDESFKNPRAPKDHVWRTELPEKRVNSLVNQLDDIFIGSKEKFKGKHAFVNWIDYPYVKASYSAYKLGQWTTIAGLESEPVGNFFFAGEHCSEMFQGFMNGAAESGREVGELLAAAADQFKVTADEKTVEE